MKTMKKFVTVLAVAAMAAACGEDGPTNGGGITVADLAGAWTASKFEYAAQSDPTNIVADLVALGGVVSVTLASDGSYTASLLLPGAPAAVPFAGTISISGSVLTLAVSDTVSAGPIELLPSEPFIFDTFALSGNQLTLNSTDVEFDFTLGMCGSPPCPEIPSTLLLILNRT